MPSDTYLGPGAESILCSFLVGCFALPGCKSRGLERTTVREGQLPGAVEGHLVDSVQVDRGLLLTLAARQEADACKDAESSSLLVRRKYGETKGLFSFLKGKADVMTHQEQKRGQCASERSLLPLQPPEG